MPISGREGYESGPRVVEIQRGVLVYWMEHPEAKDTVEGIVQWWLPGAASRWGASELVAALEQLVRRGWITASGRRTGPCVYGLGEGRLDEIKKFLER